MKAYAAVTKRFFAQIWSDAMLAALLFVPLIMGALFRFGVPALEAYLCQRTGRAALLTPYYTVFDLLLTVMPPLMCTAAGAMVMLDEADMGLTRAIAVTPVGRLGYLLSRIGVPAAFATVYCAAVTMGFCLSGMQIVRILLLAVSAGFMGAAVSLMIASLARNKVEGLAFTKLSGLFVLGLPAALFIPAPYKYLAGVLPTLWMTQLAMGGSPANVIPACVASMLWAAVFVRYFINKILA